MKKINYPLVIEKSCKDLAPNESDPYIDVDGFREYDMRWIYPDQINLFGFKYSQVQERKYKYLYFDTGSPR